MPPEQIPPNLAAQQGLRLRNYRRQIKGRRINGLRRDAALPATTPAESSYQHKKVAIPLRMEQEDMQSAPTVPGRTPRRNLSIQTALVESLNSPTAALMTSRATAVSCSVLVWATRTT